MTRFVMALLAAVFLMARTAVAQDATYIQIEARPSLTQAEDRVRDYSSYLQDVNGFSLGAAGWYGIALGPYGRAEAEARLRQLRAQGQIPGDSFIVDSGNFRRQFWPVGGGVMLPQTATPSVITQQPLDPLNGPGTLLPGTTLQGTTGSGTTGRENTVPQNVAPETAGAQAIAEPMIFDETPREAAASESRLNRVEREQLQVALRWAGFYNSAIDGAFGRGTRNSMADWQQAQGFEPTGMLTTRQRDALLRQYNAVLEGMDLQMVRETRAGIAMQIPMGVVAFEKYESPFVQYAPTGDLPVRVLLISQPGDQTTLFGLYEILQTLEIVPLDGERERRSDGFTLTGANSRIVSHTEARLEGGQIKGFTLIWPVGDEERRSRVLDAMQSSFTPIPGVLELNATADSEPSIDLLSGLQIRRPRLTASGFYIDGAGTVVTARNAVANCGRITLEDQYDARILAEDAATGIAVLRADTALAPQSVARFRSGLPRLQSEVAVSGYSFGGVLSAPTLTYGTLEDARGLAGEENMKRLALASLPGDAGGPVLDAGGAVLGMLLPREESNRQLPQEVSFAAKSEDIQALLGRAGLRVTPMQDVGAMAPEDLTMVAIGMTVLVSCWE